MPNGIKKNIADHIWGGGGGVLHPRFFTFEHKLFFFHLVPEGR